MGSCHAIEYTPLPAAQGAGWAGVFYQHPATNWGASPGLPVEPGATSVTFWARAESGAPTVTFGAGGLGDAFEPYADTVQAEIEVTLTTEWTEYTIDISSQTYTEVLGGFLWAMGGAEVNGPERLVFYLDHIQWEDGP